MKSYVTLDEAKAVMPDATSDEVATKIMWLATIMVDEMTFHKIRDFERLTPHQQEHVKQATLEQIKHLVEMGADDDNWSGVPGRPLGGWSITDVSMSYASSSPGLTAENDWLEANGYSGLAYLYLKQTGLTWRGV